MANNSARALALDERNSRMKKFSWLFPLTAFVALQLVGCVAEPDTSESEIETDDFTSANEDALTSYCNDVATATEKELWLESEVLRLTNARRAAGATCSGTYYPPNNVALILDERLRCAGRKHSKDMGDNNFASHNGTGGSTYQSRIAAAGYTSSYVGEVIAAGTSMRSVEASRTWEGEAEITAAAQGIVNGWINSTGHCRWVMDPNFTHAGVGHYYNSGSTYKHYLTQDFARQE
jgi:uncharacterized protein YkwD